MKRHSRLAHLLSVTLALLLAFPPVTAFAGQEEARKHFKEAKQAYSEGEYERAAELLEKAYAEEPNLTYQYNRIRALEGAGNYEKALEVLSNYEQPMLDAKGFQDIQDIKKSLQKKAEEEPEPTEDKTADNLRETKNKDREQEGDEPATAATDVEGESDGGDSAKASQIVGWGLLGLGTAFGVPALIYGTESALPDQATQETVNQHRVLTGVFGTVALGTGIAGLVILLNNKKTESEKSADKAPIRPRLTPYASPERAGAILHFQF